MFDYPEKYDQDNPPERGDWFWLAIWLVVIVACIGMADGC